MLKEKKELKQRKPIWKALSEFYLDTNLSEEDITRITKIFIGSKLDFLTLKEIDLYEVFPTLQSNLASVAGAWSGFDEVWLYENCKIQYIKRNNLFHRIKCQLKNKLLYRMRKRYWDMVESQIKLVRDK